MPTFNHCRLGELRRKRGLTQPQIADAIGKSTSTYSRYENGSIVPTVAILGDIAAVHGIAVDELYDADDPADPIVKFAAEIHAMVETMPPFTPEQKARLRVLLRGVA